MFTLEIAGRAVAVTDAPETMARELFESSAFQEDLRAFTSEGRAVWDGAAAMLVRPATAEEEEEFEGALLADEEFDFDDLALDEGSNDNAFDPAKGEGAFLSRDAAGAEDEEDLDEDDEDDEGGPQIMFLIDIDQLDA